MPRPQLNDYEKKLRKEISNNLKKLSNGMTQNQISDNTGIPSSTISGYFAQRSTINAGNAQKLADFFNVSIDEIDPRFKEEIFSNVELIDKISNTSLKLEPPRQEKVLNYAEEQLEEQNQKTNNVSSIEEYKSKYNSKDSKIPFTRIGTTGAGIGEDLYDDILKETVYFDRSEVDEELLETADFCIYVNGDSMEPAIKRDTYSFVRKTVEIRDGLVALVIYDGTVLIKKIEILDDAINLVSLNPKYDTIKVEPHHQFKLIGKIVQ